MMKKMDDGEVGSERESDIRHEEMAPCELLSKKVVRNKYAIR